MKKSIDNESNAGRIIAFSLLLFVIIGLFVYVHFLKAPHEHIAGNNAWVVESAATCTEQGYRYKVCTTCGLSFGAEDTPKLSHKYANPVKENVVEATCSKGGSYDLVSYCKDCGAKGDKQHVTEPMKAHTEAAAVEENKVAPTCTETGSYDSVVYCSVCKIEVKRETVEVEATGHRKTTKETDRQNPTCTNEGSYTKTTYCLNGCDFEEINTYPIEAKGHRYVADLIWDEEMDALAIDNLHCSVCSTEAEYDVEDCEITYVITLEPTCKTTGTIVYTASFSYEGSSITAKCERDVPVISHYIMATDAYGNEYNVIDTAYDDSDPDNIILGYKYDAELDILYYDISIPGIKEVVGWEWDSNGYSVGVYYCGSCGKGIAVTVYDAEYDVRQQSNS